MSQDHNYYQANRGIMAAFLPTHYERVLEIGCGSGAFANHLRQPCETWGVEPNAEAAAEAATHMGRVLCGRYDEVVGQIPDHYFDLVICNDVIEHMPDHDWFLEAIKAKLHSRGCIVGSIPNVRHVTALYKLLIARDWPYRDSGILDRTHLRFFTRKSLLRTLREHGYAIERFRGIGSVIVHGVLSSAAKKSSALNLAYRMLSLLVVVLSLGIYNDTQYPQFGFRIRAPS